MVSGVPLIGWAKPVPVNVRRLRHAAARLRARRRGRPGEQPGARGRRRRCCCALLPVSPVTLGEPNVSAPLAALLSRAMQLNVLLAVFNMIPIPPLDGGNVLAGLLPRPLARAFDRAPAVRLPPALRADADAAASSTSSCRRHRFIALLAAVTAVTTERARRVRHAADRTAAPRPSGRRARQLGAAAGRSTTASTSSPTGTR